MNFVFLGKEVAMGDICPVYSTAGIHHLAIASSIVRVINNKSEKKEKLFGRGNMKSEFLMWHFLLEKKAFTYI